MDTELTIDAAWAELGIEPTDDLDVLAAALDGFRRTVKPGKAGLARLERLHAITELLTANVAAIDAAAGLELDDEFDDDLDDLDLDEDVDLDDEFDDEADAARFGSFTTPPNTPTAAAQSAAAFSLNDLRDSLDPRNWSQTTTFRAAAAGAAFIGGWVRPLLLGPIPLAGDVSGGPRTAFIAAAWCVIIMAATLVGTAAVSWKRGQRDFTTLPDPWPAVWAACAALAIAQNVLIRWVVLITVAGGLLWLGARVFAHGPARHRPQKGSIW